MQQRLDQLRADAPALVRVLDDHRDLRGVAALRRVGEDVAEADDLPVLTHHHQGGSAMPTRQPVQLRAMPVGDGEVALVAALLGTAVVHGGHGVGILWPGHADPHRAAFDRFDPTGRVLVAGRGGDRGGQAQQGRGAGALGTLERRPRTLQDDVSLRCPLQAHHVGAVVLALHRRCHLDRVCLDKLGSGKRGDLGGVDHCRRTVEDTGRQVEGVIRGSLADVGMPTGGQRSSEDHICAHRRRRRERDVDGPELLTVTDDLHGHDVHVQRGQRSHQPCQ